jgi:UDP-N-acetylglucosamine acyltransferase
MDSTNLKNTIHPSAIIDGKVTMGVGNVIGPHVVIEGDVVIGDDNIIETGTAIFNQVVLGNNNHFYPYVVIGSLGEMGAKGDRFIAEGKVKIGNNVTVREFVCVHSPVHTLETRIDDHAYLMNKSYVAHDVIIGHGTIINAGVMLAGRVVVEDYATIGMGTAVHQQLTVGAYSMIGMQTPVTRNVLPYAKVVGNPARILGFNAIAAERLGWDKKWMNEMEKIFSKDVVLSDFHENPMMQQVSAFIKAHPGSLILNKY